MRKTYLLLVAFFTSLILNAQVTVGDNEAWWGYYTFNSTTSNYGTETEETYDVAMKVPANYAVGTDGTVNGMRFYITTPYNLSGVKVWVSRNLPASGDKADLEVVELVADSLKNFRKGDMNEVRFSQNYSINDGIYVGYSLTVDKINFSGDDDDNYPIVTTGIQGNDDAMWVRTSKTHTSWQSVADELAIQVLLGGTIRTNGVAIDNFNDCNSLLNGEGTAQFSIINLCKEQLNSIDYTVTGSNTYNGHYDLQEAENVFGARTTVTLNIPGDNTTGIHTQTLRITKVNGQDNELPEQYASVEGNVLTVIKNSPRRTVVEEYTGTWCGYCPRGIGGLNAIESHYGDDVVLVAAHRGSGNTIDSMQIDAYDHWTDSIINIGFPKAVINRHIMGDPYWGTYQGMPFGIQNDIDAEQAYITEGSVELGAWWTDASHSKILARSNAILQFDSDESNYALAYVLIADSLSGTGAGWYQKNYMHGNSYYADDEWMKEFVEAPSTIKDMKFRHVAIDAIGIDNGLEGSISAPFSAGDVHEHETTFNISSNRLVQDKNKLKVAVFLINTKNGRIVNSAETTIGSETDGINNVENNKEAHIVAIYSVDGKRQPSLCKGLNIVKMSNGHTIKIMK
ncbi:MAG: hypothetical protein ACOYJG_03190 [Prevotella sp.]|jgi:thiol-disulfide isomerase/thioredoxin